MTDYRLRHGEAVAIGMALDIRYSVESDLLDAASGDRACALLEDLGLTLWDDALTQTNKHGVLSVLQGLDEFREHLGGELTVTLLQGIGNGIEVNDIDIDRVVRCIDWLRSRQ
jgi:3-dehydroquinate synthase